MENKKQLIQRFIPYYKGRGFLANVYKAYLMARVRPGEKGHLEIDDIGIYSEGPDSITHEIGKENYACFMTREGDDFSSAQQEIIDFILAFPEFEWMRPYFKQEKMSEKMKDYLKKIKELTK